MRAPALPTALDGTRLLIMALVALAAGAALLGRLLWTDIALTHAMAVHATLMITAWAAMMPLGGAVARYFKVTPRQDFPTEVENLVWWHWHRALQYGGLAVATIGFAVILSETGGRFDTWHGRCGLLVMLLGALQFASALLRGTKGGPTDARADPADPATWRGDHYDMTRRRRLFESWHKRFGWATILLANLTVLLGLALIDAPAWLVGIVALLQTGVLMLMVESALRGRWVDTQVALWGPEPRDVPLRRDLSEHGTGHLDPGLLRAGSAGRR